MVTVRKPVPGVSRLALARFTARARRLVRLPGDVQVLVTTSQEMRELNRRFRGLDQPTDVLSFPAAAGPGGRRAAAPAGDIAISADIARHNARRLGHAPAQELKVLILHGLLHLAGYDHERDDGAMARREVRLRRALRLPETLLQRASAATKGTPREGKP